MWNIFKKKEYVYALVKFGIHKILNTTDEGYWYLVKERLNVEPNDIVIVPADNDAKQKTATVIRCEVFSKNDVPYPVEQTKEIVDNLSEALREGKKFDSKYELVGVVENNLDKLVFKSIQQCEYKIVNIKCNNYLLTDLKYEVNTSSENLISINGSCLEESLQNRCNLNLSIEYLNNFDAVLVQGVISEMEGNKKSKEIYYSIDDVLND